MWERVIIHMCIIMYLVQHLHGYIVWCGVAVWEWVIIHNYVFTSAISKNEARVSLALFICLSFSVSVLLSASLFIFRCFSLSVCLSLSLSLCLSHPFRRGYGLLNKTSLSLSLSLCLSVSVCLSVCLSQGFICC